METVIHVHKIKWHCKLWKPGDSLDFVQNENCNGTDTEYEIREPGDPEYNVVIMTVAWPKAGVIHAVWYPHIQQYIHEVYQQNSELIWYFFNTPVDLYAVDYWNTPLYDLHWSPEYYVKDMFIRMPLFEITHGYFYYMQGLAAYSKKYLKEEVSKDSDIRENFHRNMELTEADLNYACKDAALTVALGEEFPEQPLEDLKAKGNMALFGMSERGYPIDVDRMYELREKEYQILLQHLDFLTAWGLWPGPSSYATTMLGKEYSMQGSSNEAEKILKAFEHQYGIEFKRTKKSGAISTKEDEGSRPFEKAGWSPHPLIQARKDFAHSRKMLSTYLQPKFVKEDSRVHPVYTAILANGRTSAKEPPIQTLPQKGGHRTMFVPPEGYLLLVIDIDQGELCTLAQANYSEFGYSAMRDRINEGYDLHKYFAQEYMIKELMGQDPFEFSKDELKKHRTGAKPVNFGYPGGFGIDSWIDYAWNTFGIEFNREQAKKLKQLWLKAYPECQEHLKPPVDDYYQMINIRNRLYKEGLSGPLNVDTVDDAIQLMNSLGWEDETISNILFETSAYYIVTYHGRTMRNCHYTNACNFRFSVPMADGMSYIKAELERHKTNPLTFIHDEFHFPIKIGPDMQKDIKYCEDLVRDSFQKMVPDVTVSIESQLMRRWYKDADELRDDDGNLLEWTPE